MSAQPMPRLRAAGPPPESRGAGARLASLATSRTAGFVLLGASAASFLALALLALFRESLLLRLDVPIQREVLASREGWLDTLMAWVSLLGTRYVIGAILLGVAGWALATRRCRRVVLVLVLAFAANFVLEVVLKLSVGRPRPDLLRLVPGRGPSFPSGHVLATVGFYGVLAALTWKSTPGPWRRAAAYAAATAVILGVGFSRIYLGVHWFSDVVAGFAVGTAFVLTVAWALRGHHLGRARACCRGHLAPVG